MTYIYAMFPDNRIRELRKRKGWSQTQLGEAVGLHQTQIGKLENSGRSLTFEWARRIAAALDVRLVDLLDDNDNPDRLHTEERTMVKQYRRASPEQRRILARIVEPLDTNGNDNEAPPVDRGHGK